jgi:osmotically-inducible protein OsmY
LAIAAIATLGPIQAFAGDRDIAEQIMQRLKSSRDSGALTDFTLDMKVDKGVVLFRGDVSQAKHKNEILNAASGIDGVAQVVDELSVQGQAAEAPPAVAEAVATDDQQGFSLRQALAAEAKKIIAESPHDLVPGEIRHTAAVELAAPVASKDQKIVSSVVSALGKAQKSGELKGFGVDVKSNQGVVSLKGRASSAAQRNRILEIAESVAGVQRVQNSITIPEAPSLPAPPVVRQSPRPLKDLTSTSQPVAPKFVPAATQLAPVAVDPVSRPAPAAAAPVGVPAMAAPYRNQAMHTPATPASMPMMGTPVPGAPVIGQPVSMGTYGAGAPRYDSPNLPNYAWPGYSAYPNYAAVTYPQQYSPSAWPYIGPFYPYPQVPMGWRRVSLEWKDGWWFLDFTDR